MNRFIRSFLTAASLFGAAAGALAQPLVVPLEFRQSEIPYNFQATRGVPISTVSNTPPGSDGRMPTVNESGSALLPTSNQFRSFVSFGGVGVSSRLVAYPDLRTARGKWRAILHC